eukprot:SAG31_NODE_40_length_31360_cov_6.751575_3_plen_331_part_00
MQEAPPSLLRTGSFNVQPTELGVAPGSPRAPVGMSSPKLPEIQELGARLAKQAEWEAAEADRRKRQHQENTRRAAAALERRRRAMQSSEQQSEGALRGGQASDGAAVEGRADKSELAPGTTKASDSTTLQEEQLHIDAVRAAAEEQAAAERAAAKEQAERAEAEDDRQRELAARKAREAAARERAAEAERERQLKQDADENRRREQAAAEARMQKEAADTARRRAEHLEWMAGEAGRRRQARQDTMRRHREWTTLSLKLQLLAQPQGADSKTRNDYDSSIAKLQLLGKLETTGGERRIIHATSIAEGVQSARRRQRSLFERQGQENHALD